MQPKTVSASALATFSLCEAYYRAEWIERVPSEDNSAALLGTTCHSALEDFVASGRAQEGAPLAELEELFTGHYFKNFESDDRLIEGLGMMKRWYDRQNWDDRTVLSTEEKRCFNVPTKYGPVQFNFIMDRVDRDGAGNIVVVDYKSNMVPFTFDEMRTVPQPRLYGMSARLQFSDAPQLWVEFDFLRHEPIAVLSSLAENKSTWEWLIRVIENIFESDGTKETINKNCIYCPRKHDCATLQKHILGGGPLGLSDPLVAAQRRMDLANAQKAIKKMIEELDTNLVAYLEAEGASEIEVGNLEIKMSAGRRRHADGPIIAKIVGTDIYAKYADIPIGKLETMLKEEDLTPEQVTAAQNNINWRFNRVGLKVNEKGPIDE